MFTFKKGPEIQKFSWIQCHPKAKKKKNQFTKLFFKDQLLLIPLSKKANLILNK